MTERFKPAGWMSILVQVYLIGVLTLSWYKYTRDTTLTHPCVIINQITRE